MKRSQVKVWMAAGLLLAFGAAFAAPALSAEKTITGSVNDNYQIVTPGQIYEIADTPQGNDLAENHVGAKVRVTGTVEERDDMKIITVTSYKILAE